MRDQPFRELQGWTRVGSLEGVKAIVEAPGGIWGKSRLEDKFERFERAIYSTVQRADETHSEDKKRLIVESQGSLEYREVVSNLKLLGGRFFHEVHSTKKQNNPMTETYEGHDQAPAESTYNLDDWTEEEWIESLANDGDEDAALIMDLPELTEETLMSVSQENSKQVLCGCESRDTGVLRVLWETNEGEIIVLAHKGEMVTECENCDVRTSLPESAFASTAQSPEAKSMHDAEASAFSSFSTRDALGIVDTGATKTVIGGGFVANLLAALKPEVRKQVQRCRCSVVFRFGNPGTLESQRALVVPIGPLKLKIAIVPGRTPFLLSNTLLRAIGATVDISGEVIKSTLLKRNIPIQLNAKGLFLVDLNDLITPASQDAEAEPAETFATLNCKSLPSVSVQKPGQVQSETKTMMKQNVQVRTGLVTSRIQQFEAAMPESTKTHTNTKKPNERPSVRGVEKVSFESVPGGPNPVSSVLGSRPDLCNHTRVTIPFVHLCRITIMPTSEAAALSARLARVMGEAKKEEARDQFEAFQLLPLNEMGQTKIDFGSAHLGRTYSEMWEKEAKYVKWFQASYHSSNKVNHQKFIHYISLRVTYAEHQLGLNSQDPQPSPSQRPLHPAIKSKAKAKPIQEVTPQDLADLAEDESWEPVQEIEIQPEIHTEMAAMDTRLQTIEGAMQEIIAHLRAS